MHYQQHPQTAASILPVILLVGFILCALLIVKYGADYVLAMYMKKHEYEPRNQRYSDDDDDDEDDDERKRKKKKHTGRRTHKRTYSDDSD